MLAKVDEVFGVDADVEALQDVGQVVREMVFFIFSEKSSTSVDNLSRALGSCFYCCARCPADDVFRACLTVIVSY